MRAKPFVFMEACLCCFETAISGIVCQSEITKKVRHRLYAGAA